MYPRGEDVKGHELAHTGRTHVKPYTPPRGLLEIANAALIEEAAYLAGENQVRLIMTWLLNCLLPVDFHCLNYGLPPQE